MAKKTEEIFEAKDFSNKKPKIRQWVAGFLKKKPASPDQSESIYTPPVDPYSRVNSLLSRGQAARQGIESNRADVRRYLLYGELEELKRQQRHALERAIYQEGGIRFYAELLAQEEPESADSADELWLGMYNRCIDPMRWRGAKLKQNLDELNRQYTESFEALQKLESGTLPSPEDDLQLASRLFGFYDAVKQLRSRYGEKIENSETGTLNMFEKLVEQDEEALQKERVWLEQKEEAWSADRVESARTPWTDPRLDELDKLLSADELREMEQRPKDDADLDACRERYTMFRTRVQEELLEVWPPLSEREDR